MKNVNKASTKKAIELLDYLHGISGKGIITGQHTQTRKCEEIGYIREITGREPKLRGYELLSYSPNINPKGATVECITEIEENKKTLDDAFDFARTTDGILTFTFHWFSPVGGRDKSFYTENTDFDPSRVLVGGSPERKAFYHDMDVIADVLKRFMDADIPVLWRPFHESEGTWFWWGAKGPEVSGELYKLMYDHFVREKHLDNLVWVWNSNKKEGYPGDEYVDVVSYDSYLSGYSKTDYRNIYDELMEIPGEKKAMALAEVGYLPDIEILERERTPWAYFMLWSKEFCIGDQYNKKEELRKFYNSEYAIKL